MFRSSAKDNGPSGSRATVAVVRRERNRAEKTLGRLPAAIALPLVFCLLRTASAEGLTLVYRDGEAVTLIDRDGIETSPRLESSSMSVTAKSTETMSVVVQTPTALGMEAGDPEQMSASPRVAQIDSGEADKSVEPKTPTAAETVGKALDGGETIRFEGVYFDHDQSTLKPASLPAIAVLAAALNLNPELRVQVEGHTDHQGSEAYNLELSRRRAETVITALVEQGVTRSNLQGIAFGFARPLVSNATEEGRAQNRRVEIRRMD